MAQQPAPAMHPPITAPQSFLRRHRALLIWSAVLLVIYVVAAATVLPPSLVSLTAGKADANTQLNAVTATRAALLGAVTPIVVLFGGIAALLNYQETAEQNRRINERAREERDEARRLRRAEVYAEMLSATDAVISAAISVWAAAVDEPGYRDLVAVMYQKGNAMNVASERVGLLGSDDVQASTVKLELHNGEMGAKALAKPKTPKDEWTQVLATNAKYFREFHDAARTDLAPLR